MSFLNSISIKGEITNFKAHYTGHYYFTLKDEASTIKCVMFKGYAQYVKFKPADGMKVIINGQVSVFERDGSISNILQINESRWTRRPLSCL